MNIKNTDYMMDSFTGNKNVHMLIKTPCADAHFYFLASANVVKVNERRVVPETELFSKLFDLKVGKTDLEAYIQNFLNRNTDYLNTQKEMILQTLQEPDIPYGVRETMKKSLQRIKEKPYEIRRVPHEDHEALEKINAREELKTRKRKKK